MKFRHQGTPGSILTIMGALCLFALSAVLIGLMRLIGALVGPGVGGWHGISPWFLVVVVPYALRMIAGAILVVAVPFALAMLVNNKPARTPQNLIVAGLGVLFALGWLAWVLSIVTR